MTNKWEAWEKIYLKIISRWRNILHSEKLFSFLDPRFHCLWNRQLASPTEHGTDDPCLNKNTRRKIKTMPLHFLKWWERQRIYSPHTSLCNTFWSCDCNNDELHCGILTQQLRNIVKISSSFTRLGYVII